MMKTQWILRRACFSNDHSAAARIAAAIAAVLLFMIKAPAPIAAPVSLEAGFAKPPRQARPLTWWHWINGNITQAGIRADLEDMKRVGIGGVQMLDVSIYLPPGPVRYGTNAWYEHVQYAIRTAAELGLEFDIMNGPGWSASGGPWNTPERSMKQLTWSETDVEGGSRVDVALPRPAANLDFYRDVAVLAVPWSKSAPKLPTNRHNTPPPLSSVMPMKLDTTAAPITPERVIDLTNSMNAAGALQYALPPGRWTLLRFGFTTTGSMNHPAEDEGHGLECDKFDAAAVAFQFDHALGRILREAGPLAGRTFSGVLFDSFEGGYQNWTDALPAKFRRAKGYDLTLWLPVLTGRVVGSVAESEAFLRDFRDAVNDLLAHEYFGTMWRLAHRHGLKVYAEAQGGPLDPLICNEFTDVPMNEFWMPDAAPRFQGMKQIAAVANVLGRPVVGAESFTAKPEDGRWLATPATMKLPGDCAFAAGINRFIFHTYVHQPYAGIAPGFTLGRYGTHFGRLNTWWPFAGAWIAYLSRCQFLLQQGRTVADLCLVLDEHTGFPAPAQALAVPEGYDFDACYARHLAAMTWRDGSFRLPHGAAYRVLVLPDKWVADLATLRRLKSFVEAGGRVVGSLPESPAGLLELRDHARPWHELIEVLRRGIPPRGALEVVLKQAGIGPDFVATAADVHAIHRATGEGDLYFLTNQSSRAISFQGDFRAGGRLPELWDPVTGRIQDAGEFTARAGRVLVPLRLEASGSIFVVFRRPLPTVRPASGGGANAPAPAPVVIAGPWEVRFQQGRGAPEKIRLERLTAWNRYPNPRVRYFSGIGTYVNSFTLPADFQPEGMRCLLDLGKVCDIAEVKINGQRAGVAWTAPFALDVTGQLRPGNNTLEIAVANRWANRLIGDEALPPDTCYATNGSKFTIGRLSELPGWLNDPQALSRRQRSTFATWHLFERDSPLVDSGLLGPVRLEYLRTK